MKHTKAVVLAVIAVLATASTVAYMQRAEIAERFRSWQQPDVPESVGYEEFVKDQKDEGDGGDLMGEAEKVEGEVTEITDGENEKQTVDEEEKQEFKKIEEEQSTDNNLEEDNAEQDAGHLEKGEQATQEEEVETSDEEVADQQESDLPKEINLAVPFTPQAPHADWSPPYKEACEEASVYMVAEYYAGTPEGTINPDEANEELLKLVEFEKSIFGYYEDTTVQQTGIFAEKFYGFEQIEEIENPTIEQIKSHVAAGRPVIVPAAGRELSNPYYTPPGPYYHMLVIRGYTDDGFVTNDPGTRRGKDYVYSYEKIMSSIHDYNETDMQQGKKVVLVIYPPR